MTCDGVGWELIFLRVIRAFQRIFSIFRGNCCGRSLTAPHHPQVIEKILFNRKNRSGKAMLPVGAIAKWLFEGVATPTQSNVLARRGLFLAGRVDVHS